MYSVTLTTQVNVYSVTLYSYIHVENLEIISIQGFNMQVAFIATHFIY